MLILTCFLLTVVSNAWLETLLSAINALPKETIKQEVVIRVADQYFEPGLCSGSTCLLIMDQF